MVVTKAVAPLPRPRCRTGYFAVGRALDFESVSAVGVHPMLHMGVIATVVRLLSLVNKECADV